MEDALALAEIHERRSRVNSRAAAYQCLAAAPSSARPARRVRTGKWNRRAAAGVEVKGDGSARHSNREHHVSRHGYRGAADCHGAGGGCQAEQGAPAWCGRELCDAVRREVSRRVHKPAQPRRRACVVRGRRRNATIRVELDGR